MGCRWALLQVDHHLLENSKAKALAYFHLFPDTKTESLGLLSVPVGTLRWAWEGGLYQG